MKKKFIRALLFGALIGLQATAFVSCKDYDDDINALRTEITTNASDLKSLVDEKMKNVETEISALQATANGLETAYKAADKALETAITNATNDAKGYADVQAAEAQKAAVASAQTLVDNATKKLEESLAASNKVIDEQGKSIAALLEADVKLSEAIVAAQTRANEAYALAEKAKALAEAAGESAAELKTALAGVTKDLGEVKSSIAQMKEQVEAVDKKYAEEIGKVNKTLSTFEAQYAKLTDLTKSNDDLKKVLSDKDNELNRLIGANATEIGKLQNAINELNKEGGAVDGAVTTAQQYTDSKITTLQGTYTGENQAMLTLAQLQAAYEAADKALEGKINTLDGKVTTLDNTVKAMKAKLDAINPYLEENLSNLVTGIIVQDQNQLQMVYAQVNVNAGSIVNGKVYAERPAGATRNTVYFPYKGAENAAPSLYTGHYNVEKNMGKIYFTVNPTTIDFTNNLPLKLENSLGQNAETAGGSLTLSDVKAAEDHLVTRAAAKNGFYSARVSYTAKDKTVNPLSNPMPNQFALCTSYKTKKYNAETEQYEDVENGVYSKYEVKLNYTPLNNSSINSYFDAYQYIEAVGAEQNPLPYVDARFTSQAGAEMVGKFKLHQVAPANGVIAMNYLKPFRKYVEIEAVKDSRNISLAGNDLKAVIDAMKAANPNALNKVFEEPAGDPQDVATEDNGFDQITLTVPTEYKGYTFTLVYYAQAYNGKVAANKLKVMFVQPLFDGGEVAVAHTPAASTVQTTGIVALGNCATNMNLWKTNTAKIVASGDIAKIKSVVLNKTVAQAPVAVKTLDAAGSWTAAGLDAATIGTFTSLNLTYDPADVTVGQENVITLTSYDTNGNVVCIQNVKFTMNRPTSCATFISPNPAYFGGNADLTALNGETLNAWAYYAPAVLGTSPEYAYYNVTAAFNNGISDAHACAMRFEIAADQKPSYTSATGANKAFEPFNGLAWKGAATTDYIVKVPVGAVKKDAEHAYPMVVGVEYFGVPSLWKADQNFKLVFKSPIAHANVSFSAASYNVEYPNSLLKITETQVRADNPATSVSDKINYFTATTGGRNALIADVQIELVQTQYASLFNAAQTMVVNDGIQIKTSEAVVGGTASVNATGVQFNLVVTDVFGNVMKYPFYVNVKSN